MAKDTEGAGFSDAERQAMKDRAAETRKRSKRLSPEEAEAALQEKIAELPDDDRALAQRIHEIVMDAAPSLQPKTYYGMPAYAKDGKTLVFFQPASKFKVRYGTLGFETIAALDDGDMWPTSFAVLAITDEVEQRIRELVARASG